MNAAHQNTHPLLRPGGLGLSLISQGLTDQIAIEEAIEIYEPRAEILDIQCRVVPDQNSITATIKFKIVNSLEVVVLETQIARLR